MKIKQYGNAKLRHYGKRIFLLICVVMTVMSAAPVFGAPGQTCGCRWYGCGTRDCNNVCRYYIYDAWYNSWNGDYGDGNCDEYLNCSAFGYDGGDCVDPLDCFIDDDGDGYAGTPAVCSAAGAVPNREEWCDDDPARNPGLSEICDGIDNDCNGAVDDGIMVTYYYDDDNDGYGTGSAQYCDAGVAAADGYDATQGGDCDDTNAAINPGVTTDGCDGVNNDCDGATDEDAVLSTYYYDDDNDGYGTSSAEYCDSLFAAADGYDATQGGDCDDTNSSINPGATEQCDNVDHNCIGGPYDGLALTTYYRDADGDTFGDPANPSDYCGIVVANNSGYVSDNTDCDDGDPNVNPNATEICDNIDNNCDTVVDEGFTKINYYHDGDGDGYGGLTPVPYCDDPASAAAAAAAGDITTTGDCDDTDSLVNPGATEICSTPVDENCDGLTPPCGAGDECDCDDSSGAWVCTGIIDCDGNCESQTYWGDGVCNTNLQCAELNWDNGDCPILAECYSDLDGDGYGDNNSLTVLTANKVAGVCPAGYVDNSDDCNDDPLLDPNAPFIHPGAGDATCDNIDDDCDGDFDEDATIITYYQDGDGDGYGNSAITMDACAPPANFVDNSSDCNDTNAEIHPGAYDLCENGLDEDCNGSDRVCGETPNVCANLSDFPLETQVESAPPLVMLLMDDSGSMAWSTLCPEDNGLFNGQDNYYDTDPSWKSQWSGYNGIYYNPDVDYLPWPDTGTATYEDADTDTPKYHPNGTSTRTLNNAFFSSSNYNLDGVNVRWSHYYAWSSTQNAPYLVNIVGTGGSYRLDYYKVTNCDNGQCTSDHSYVNDSNGLNNATTVASPPGEVVSGRTAAEERQNFANWYQYSRTRQLTAISALANVVNTVQGMKIGLHSINHNNGINMIAPRDVDTNRGPILDDLYDVGASGGTPLRRGLQAVGNYYDNDSSGPYDTAANGGECQQAYTIMMTDGYYNGYDPNVGNADKNDDGSQIDGFDGGEFEDDYSNTLADVAMYYYEHDLNATLANVVPASTRDNITNDTMHQHMVTYSISFGLKGLYDPEDVAYDCPGTNCPAWPNVTRYSEDERSITDLWHAAVNGRGIYMEATNAQQLAYALVALMQAVSKDSGQGASVAVNSQKLKQGTKMYQGTYNSAGWSGDLRAYEIFTSGAVDQDYTWSASEELKARIANNTHLDRNIYTTGASGGVEFLYGNIGSLTSFQQNALGADPAARQNIINFIRGDLSNDGNHSGSLRVRTSPLGDIVHSEPKFVNGYLYVGGNDGMFHVFNAATGAEVFAYIPSFVYASLSELANPDYTHRYFEDSTAFLGYYGTDVLLVSGLGKGGKGYFCLDIDINSPASFSVSNVKWEYPDSGSSAAESDNLGYTFSEPVIINTESAGEVLIFGNGYDSLNARAVLYALDPSTGNMLKMVDTGYGSPVLGNDNCNGLSTPVFIDSNNNGKADYAYAGDLRGNVWKFDISGAVTNWEVAYQDGSGNPKPVFQARDSAGNPQPITSRIAVRGHCVRGYAGYMLLFGTGKFNAAGDFADTSTQAVYGIWDWAKEWDEEDLTGDSSDKYFGIYNSPVAGQLSNMVGHTDFSTAGVQLGLVSQSQSGGTVNYNFEDWGFTSSNEINWFDVERYVDSPSTYVSDPANGYHVGWTYALPVSGERVVADPVLWLDYVLIVSQVPATNMCTVGGTSYLTALNICSGAAPDEPFFDTNSDQEITEDDEINGDPPSSVELDDFITYSPTMIEKFIYFGPKESYVVDTDPSRVIFWRFFNMN